MWLVERSATKTDDYKHHPPTGPSRLARMTGVLMTEQGVVVIEAALQQILSSPGVYRMLDPEGNALYVGKARNLKRRVAAYAQTGRLPERLRRMVAETAAVETITTHTEAEALLLEANLIKRLKPRFNIVLRDDKSYPWLILTEDHPFPQIAKHRGQQAQKASYWGPFASAWAVNQTVTAMQRIFLNPVLFRTSCFPVERDHAYSFRLNDVQRLA